MASSGNRRDREIGHDSGISSSNRAARRTRNAQQTQQAPDNLVGLHSMRNNRGLNSNNSQQTSYLAESGFGPGPSSTTVSNNGHYSTMPFSAPPTIVDNQTHNGTGMQYNLPNFSNASSSGTFQYQRLDQGQRTADGYWESSLQRLQAVEVGAQSSGSSGCPSSGYDTYGAGSQFSDSTSHSLGNIQGHVAPSNTSSPSTLSMARYGERCEHHRYSYPCNDLNCPNYRRW